MVAKNEDTIKLTLGFFLLKNPSPLELKNGLSMEQRSRIEQNFFSTPAWRVQNLDPDRIGAGKLRVFLQDLLDAHIEKEIPKVRDEIKRTLAVTERELKALGNARPAIGLVRSFITSLSMRFYELFQAALDGNYLSIDIDFFSKHEFCRLRASVQACNMKFSDYMREQGQRRKLSSTSQSSSLDHESANETTQLIVSKKEMTQWVKQVR
jgi:hypothetical protein